MVVCFSTLTRNIRHRRGEKVVINVPSKSVGEVAGLVGRANLLNSLITLLSPTSFNVFFINTVFKDKNTPSPFIETFPEDAEAMKASKPDHIYMDAMGFGMGNCCLQVLFLVEGGPVSSTPVTQICFMYSCFLS